jgi:hypothetical protein
MTNLIDRSIYQDRSVTDFKPDVDTFISWMLRYTDDQTREHLIAIATETLGRRSRAANDLRPTLERFLAQTHREKTTETVV